MKETRTFKIPCTKENFYMHFLKIANGVNKLTPVELELLSKLMVVKSKLPEGTEEFNPDLQVFNIETKKTIMKEMGISEENLNNYISSLKKKNMIVLKDKKKYINENLFIQTKDLDEFNINFQFILN